MSSHQKLVDDFHTAMFVDHDPAAIAHLYAEDAVMLDAGAGEEIRGNRNIADYHAGFLRAFPDLSAEVRNVFGSGDWFAVELRITGTNTGPLQIADGATVPPTGRRISFPVCWLGRVGPDGRCAEDHTYYDNTVFSGLASRVVA